MTTLANYIRRLHPRHWALFLSLPLGLLMAGLFVEIFLKAADPILPPSSQIEQYSATAFALTGLGILATFLLVYFLEVAFKGMKIYKYAAPIVIVVFLPLITASTTRLVIGYIPEEFPYYLALFAVSVMAAIWLTGPIVQRITGISHADHPTKVTYSAKLPPRQQPKAIILAMSLRRGDVSDDEPNVIRDSISKFPVQAKGDDAILSTWARQFEERHAVDAAGHPWFHTLRSLAILMGDNRQLPRIHVIVSAQNETDWNLFASILRAALQLQAGASGSSTEVTRAAEAADIFDFAGIERTVKKAVAELKRKPSEVAIDITGATRAYSAASMFAAVNIGAPVIYSEPGANKERIVHFVRLKPQLAHHLDND